MHVKKEDEEEEVEGQRDSTEYKALALHWLTWVPSLVPHMIPWAPPGGSLNSEPEIKSWKLSGPKTKNKHTLAGILEKYDTLPPFFADQVRLMLLELK